MDQQRRVCEKLQELGYRRERTLKLYGEEIRLTSNPAPEGNGFFVEGISLRSSHPLRFHVPLPVVRMIEREILQKNQREATA